MLLTTLLSHLMLTCDSPVIHQWISTYVSNPVVNVNHGTLVVMVATSCQVLVSTSYQDKD